MIDVLNEYQIKLYGIENCNLETPHALMKNKAFMVGAFSEGSLIGIGAVKIIDSYAEVKRIFVKEGFRRRFVANTILHELETYAYRKGVLSVYLETGNRHHAAIKFYTREGYCLVNSFGHYKPNPVSIYFAKKVRCE